MSYSKILSYEEASKISGELFGNLFSRASDKEGFDYALKRILSGAATPRSLVKEFCSSEEFRELHIMNQTPNEFAKRALITLCGEKKPDPKDIKSLALQILEGDWRVVLKNLIDGEKYKSIYGEYVVPRWN